AGPDAERRRRDALRALTSRPAPRRSDIAVARREPSRPSPPQPPADLAARLLLCLPISVARKLSRRLIVLTRKLMCKTLAIAAVAICSGLFAGTASAQTL